MLASSSVPGPVLGRGQQGAGSRAERSQPVPPGWLDLGAMGSWRVSLSNRLALQRRQLRNVKILIKQVFKTSFQLRSILIDNHSNSQQHQHIKKALKSITLVGLLQGNRPRRMYTLLFSHSVVSNSLQSHGPQHTRLPVLQRLPQFAQTPIH